MKKRFILIVFVAFTFLSCNNNVILSSIVKDNKIIFLGENHSIINPRLFLIENLEELCANGVRHICIEGGSLKNTSDENYNFYCFFQWLSAGAKYEDVLLSNKINEINRNLPASKKIVIHNPEKTLIEKDLEELSYYERLNKRDSLVFEYINTLYSTTSKEEKILIFYGYEHGAKNKITKKWNTLGTRLEEKYSDFISLNFDYCLDDKQNSYIKKQNNFCNYDYLIKQNKNPYYGICYQFYSSKENSFVMIRHLLEYGEYNELFSMKSYDSLSDEREYLNDIYYLKMIYKDLFSFNFWDSNDDLKEALEELFLYVQNTDIKYNNDLDKLRDYHKYMISSGIEDYIQYSDRLNLRYTKKMLEKAYSIYQEDLWCLYWLASIELELKQYEQSILHLEKCLKYKTISCIEILPKIYEKIIFSSEKIHDNKRVQLYKTKLAKLSKEQILMVNKMNDVR